MLEPGQTYWVSEKEAKQANKKRWQEWFKYESEYFDECKAKFEIAKANGWSGLVGYWTRDKSAEGNMPLMKKGKKILGAMRKEYGSKKGESVFYASINKGKIKGAEGKK